MGKPNPAAVERYGTEEQMVAALIAAGEIPGLAREMAAMAFGRSKGDTVFVESNPPPTSPSS